MRQIHATSGNGIKYASKYPVVIHLATAIFVEAEEKLKKKFIVPDYVSAVKPKFSEQVESAIHETFAADKRLWTSAITQYDPIKNDELIAECEKLCKHFLTVQQRIENTEQLLRNLYAQHSVYIEIILIDESEFRLENYDSLVAEYSKQFQEQSTFFAEAEQSLSKLREDSPIRTFFSFRKVYKQKHGELLEAVRHTMDGAKAKWCNNLYEKTCHGHLGIFVKELNEYGRLTFKAIQEHSGADLEEPEA